MLNKVTTFILREGAQGIDLLLFKHPSAGIQLPAGTVEPGEDPQVAALREAREETGLADLPEPLLLEARIYPAPPGTTYVAQSTPVYSRPDAGSFNWAQFHSGLSVRRLRRAGDFSQVAYEEPDVFPNPNYITYEVTGWVPDAALADTLTRYFFCLDAAASTPPLWQVQTDHHIFTCFWAPMKRLPEIISPQNEWLEVLRAYLFRNSGAI